MSTTPRIRLRRTRHSRFRLASFSMVFSGLALLMAPPASIAQSTSKAGSSVSKKSEPLSARAKRLALAEAYRAGFDREPTLEDLDLFIDRSRLRRSQAEESSYASAALAKGATSLFDDMQLIPEQTFENSDGFRSPALVAISEDLLGMAYLDQGVSGPDFFGTPEVGPRALFRTSNDGGASWSDPVVVADDADFILDYNWLSISASAGGRLVIIDETPFEENHSFYSDDFGATWTEVAYEETDFLDRVFGPVNGQLWRQAGNAYPDQTAVQYETSDDGITWGNLTVMVPSIGTWNEAGVSSIAWTGGSNYIAAFDLFTDEPDCCTTAMGISRSTDNGATWSALEVLDHTEEEERSPNVTSDGAGNVYLAFVEPNFDLEIYIDDNVYTSMSTDGGATFSDPVRFTRYVGSDYNVAQAMAGSQPFIAFQSDRGTLNYRSRIWSGLGGSNPTPDLDPPPIVDWYSQPGGWAPAGVDIPISQVFAFDESGVSSVMLQVMRGEEEDFVQLFDDGEHGDEEAGDGIFGGTGDPIEFGPPLRVAPVAMDDGGNSGYGRSTSVNISALHDVGNLVTVVTPEGVMGFEPIQEFPPIVSGLFPKSEDGHSFLPYAGMWVGINKAPGKRVSHTFYDNIFGPEFVSAIFGDWQVTEYPTAGPGESELDVVMQYDDSGAAHPIGLDVKQTTYQWSDANYIIFDYVFTNQSGGDLSDLYVGMVFDGDLPVGANPFDDQVGYDADRGLIYMFDSGDWCSEVGNEEFCTDLHAGIALLSDGTDLVGKSAPTPFTAHRWSGFEEGGDPQRHPNTGLDVDAYDILTSGIWAGFNLGLSTAANEWRAVITAQPFDLAAGTTHRVVFGMVAGAGQGGILASTDAMIDRFNKAVLDVEQSSTLPTEFALGENYPNPFNPSTTIPFSVESASPVILTIFDVLGRQVDQIVNETLSPGSYKATFESKSLPSGAYYYTLTADGKSITKSMLLLK